MNISCKEKEKQKQKQLMCLSYKKTNIYRSLRSAFSSCIIPISKR